MWKEGSGKKFEHPESWRKKKQELFWLRYQQHDIMSSYKFYNFKKKSNLIYNGRFYLGATKS